MSKGQQGFMRQRSTKSNILIYTGYISENMNECTQVDAIYMEFSEAFYKIDHVILATVGVHDNLLRWFSSYIKQRPQAVVLGRCRSTFTMSTSGVPQGSHLRPLLFNLYVNGISSCFSHYEFLMYADDIKFLNGEEFFRSYEFTMISKSVTTCFLIHQEMSSSQIH